MDAEKERSIVERWPEWFGVHGEIRRTLMPLGFQHGNGWYCLVVGLCEQLEPLVRRLNENLRVRNEHFEVLEVKQKMAELRFYVSHHDEQIDSAIERARLRSLEICELCSRTRAVRLRRHNGWLVTLCEHCERGYRQRTTQDPKGSDE